MPRILLQKATSSGRSSFAAHFGLARLFVAEERWEDAVREFKLAIARRASPEAHYALGRLYYGLSSDTLAARHLRKAVALDQDYSEALHLLGLVCERGGQTTLANKYFEKAGTGSFVSASSPKVASQTRASGVTHAFRVSTARSRKLITEGERRLVNALREDALSAHGPSENVSDGAGSARR